MFKSVQGDDGKFYVVYAEGKAIGTRQSIIGYETDAKAKRRIRDLMAKQIVTAPTVAEIVEQVKVTAITSPSDLREVFIQRGVYPAVPKRFYNMTRRAKFYARAG